MVKKKQNIKKKLQSSRTVLIGAAIVLVFSILAVVFCVNQKAKQQVKTQQTPTNNESSKNHLTNPAVGEAKAVADKYFEAARNCDLETANSLRLLPKNTTLSKEECQKECPGGLTYKYLKPVTYDSKESGGVTIEFATFDYVFGCGDKTSPTLMQMMRSSDDNKWLVFSMG